MALTKYKMGELLEQCDERNSEQLYSIDDVKGISIQKIFIETKADMKDVSLKPYKLVKPDEYAYVTVTSRNGEKITLAHNDTNNTYVVSSSYIVFKIKRTDILDSDYLFIFFNRPEFDRYARFSSWGSARETFSWEEMCDIEIELPPISVQQKYVAIYKAMVANQQSYERGLEDLKLVFESYLDKLRKSEKLKAIKQYIALVETKNESLEYGIESVRGVSIEKKFIDTKADMAAVNLKPYYIVKPNEFAFVTVTSRNGEKISLAINDTNDIIICSSSYVVFRSIDENKLLPQYLMLYFSRADFNRYARFNSWGSARETFNFEDMCDVKIPIPDISIQKAIAEIFVSYNTRKVISERLKVQIKTMCPILVKGAVEEGMKS